MATPEDFKNHPLNTRINYRHRKVQMIVGTVMQIVEKHLPPISNRTRIAYALYDEFSKVGAEIISDFTRQQLGLPPRGPDGWTQEEIKAYETRLLHTMLEPFPHTIIKKDK